MANRMAHERMMIDECWSYHVGRHLNQVAELGRQAACELILSHQSPAPTRYELRHVPDLRRHRPGDLVAAQVQLGHVRQEPELEAGDRNLSWASRKRMNW